MVDREKCNLIKKYSQNCVTVLLLQDSYKGQWILNISQKSPYLVFI